MNDKNLVKCQSQQAAIVSESAAGRDVSRRNFLGVAVRQIDHPVDAMAGVVADLEQHQPETGLVDVALVEIIAWLGREVEIPRR